MKHGDALKTGDCASARLSTDWQTKNIAIIGAGHLGLALAKRMLACNFNVERITISHHGSTRTRERLKEAGLASRIATNRELSARADLIFLAIKPSDVNSLRDTVFREATVVVSCIAGLQTASLQKLLQHEVIRIMPSNPPTIEAGTAIAALFPEAAAVADILSVMNFKIYPMAAEEAFHLFTAAVCLPAAFLYLRLYQRTMDEAELLNRYIPEYDRFAEVYHWVKREAPLLTSEAAINGYLRRMATKGGITEAILESLKEGNSLAAALEKGIHRSKEIGASCIS